MKQTFQKSYNHQHGSWQSCSMHLLQFLPIIILLLILLTPFTYGMAAEIELPENRYGSDIITSPKILVVYATRAGSTAGVADAIGKKLAEGGAVVDVKPVKKVQTLNGYHAVVMGSAIRAGAVLPEITNFVKIHKDELEKLPVAYFIVCMILREDNEENRKTAASYLDPLRAKVSSLDAGMFAGKLDYSRLNFIEVFIIKYIIGTPEGDLRDWNKIDDWAINLGPKLLKH